MNMREKLEKGATYHLIWNKRDPAVRSFCIFEVIGDPVTEKGSTLSDVFAYLYCNEPDNLSPYFLIVSKMTIDKVDGVRSTNIRKADDFIEKITKERAYRLMVSYVFTKLNSAKGEVKMFGKKVR